MNADVTRDMEESVVDGNIVEDSSTESETKGKDMDSNSSDVKGSNNKV